MVEKRERGEDVGENKVRQEGVGVGGGSGEGERKRIGTKKEGGERWGGGGGGGGRETTRSRVMIAKEFIGQSR